jgi:quercetin dioxygenase-like cupin family protein
MQPDGKQYLESDRPIVGYVAKGVVELRVKGNQKQRIKAGENFYQYKDGTGAVLVNASSELPAKVIVFYLHKS